MIEKRMRLMYTATVLLILAGVVGAVGGNLVFTIAPLVVALVTAGKAEQLREVRKLELAQAMRRHPAGKAIGQ